MKKWAELALGIVTSIGGFLEVGSIATSAQAGAEFGYQLLWVLIVGTLSLAFLMEMTGRLAAVSRRTYVDHLRQCFGVRFFMAPLIVVLIVSFLVLASEVGGVSIALQMATGIGFQWWAVPVALAGWLLLWRGTFGVVEQGTAILGLVALVFAVGAVKLHPHWGEVVRAALPSAPAHDRARYWYLAVSILGASVSPYLFLFYSAGAVEDGWTEEHLLVNRVTAGLGNVFGGGLAIAVVVVAALVFSTRGIRVDRYEQISLLLASPLGRAGVALFLATLCITCFGSTLEITLSIAYLLAQGFGWEWSENLKPAKDARFAMVYTVVIVAAALPIAIGVDPLALTNLSMTLTAASLPLTVVPLLVLMNDREVLMKHVNGWMTNGALVLIALLSLVLFVAALPLQKLGGG
ncbi:MAG: divalent metal cation transporter [Gemmatimonadaceae bacterium]|nr:divalent metal cation transporter [Gemmatimonadaceae bacterium]NUP71715.1 divalent metal cation transporter [Gemmatimonadaceae bacterium]NUR34479.1 divalent metal cation transporter [Gemmatimonadaceae bacterium]NUS34641.1 divalent metal cation transporter [Gemmatimonadaceae bacterium]